MVHATSLSSHLMTSLLAWRNPQASEKNWLFEEHRYRAFPPFYKLLASEAAFPFVALAAAVETVISGVFTLLSLPLAFVDHAMTFKANRDWLKSSSFTILWSFGNAVCNFCYPNLYTRERNAYDFAFNGGENLYDLNNSCSILYDKTIRIQIYKVHQS